MPTKEDMPSTDKCVCCVVYVCVCVILCVCELCFKTFCRMLIAWFSFFYEKTFSCEPASELQPLSRKQTILKIAFEGNYTCHGRTLLVHGSTESLTIDLKLTNLSSKTHGP